jgi:AcrR family transcriptional regulator
MNRRVSRHTKSTPVYNDRVAAIPHRPRDAVKTRQLLLAAARRRFAEAGYAATTVRDIADDAGVNVALISRYYASKEGLFEACLTATMGEMRERMGEMGPQEVAEVMVAHLVDPGPGAPNQLALLLRSSGDARADQIRLGVLRVSAERIAAAAGRRPDDREALLRAQLVLATAMGITLLRASVPLEPIATAGTDALLPPLRTLIDALLPPPADTPGNTAIDNRVE